MRRETIEEVKRAIVESCSACNGSGCTVTERTGYGHACGGDEIRCQTMCPIPVPEQVQVQCEW
ncbi:hypothetical protein U2441_15665, partial [Listeria monocytogenes]|uniref:hypothetical protein n=1 Tax=Listeria monocytogenes TaxID=1639 RepID=UPI002FDC0EE2